MHLLLAGEDGVVLPSVRPGQPDGRAHILLHVLCSGSEEGSYLRLIDVCITQL